jgi:hypothetical protein
MSDTLEELVSRAGTRSSRPLDVEAVIARGCRRRRRRTALAGAGTSCLLLIVAVVGLALPSGTPAPYVGSSSDTQAAEFTSYVVTGEAAVASLSGDSIMVRLDEPWPVTYHVPERDGYWWQNFHLDGVRWRHGQEAGDGTPPCLPQRTLDDEAELLPVRLQFAEISYPDGDGRTQLLWLECLH